MPDLEQIKTALFDLADEAITESGVSVSVESNVLPELTLYDTKATGPSLLEIAGINTRIIVRDRDGRLLTAYGAPVNPNPVLMLLYGGGAVLGFIAVVSLASKLIRIGVN